MTGVQTCALPIYAGTGTTGSTIGTTGSTTGTTTKPVTGTTSNGTAPTITDIGQPTAYVPPAKQPTVDSYIDQKNAQNKAIKVQ